MAPPADGGSKGIGREMDSRDEVGKKIPKQQIRIEEVGGAWGHAGTLAGGRVRVTGPKVSRSSSCKRFPKKRRLFVLNVAGPFSTVVVLFSPFFGRFFLLFCFCQF